jgi:hypothetical protein
MNSMHLPFVLSLSKGERKVFQQLAGYRSGNEEVLITVCTILFALLAPSETDRPRRKEQQKEDSVMKKAIYLLHSLLLIAALAMNALPLAIAAEHEHAGHEWSYEGEHGPAHWGDVKTDYAVCKTGMNQSPIDITGAVKADLPPIKFAYKAALLRIINNGHSIQVNYPEGSFITVGGKQYQLVQFHFHHPSE